MTAEQQKMVEENHLLIPFLISKFAHTRIPDDKLHDCAVDAMILAVKRFDPSRAKLSTFAYRCMVGMVWKERQKKRLNRVEMEEPFYEPEVRDDASPRLRRLDPRSREVLTRYVDGETLLSISQRFKISKERARCLLEEAVARAAGDDYGLSLRVLRMIRKHPDWDARRVAKSGFISLKQAKEHLEHVNRTLR